jgi:dihydrofolate reductase
MGKFIVTMQMSLDGVVSEVERWMTLSDEMLKDMGDAYDTVDAVLVGGHTYASMAEYWQQAERTSESELERAIARKINAIKKYVISRGDVELSWNHTERIGYEDEASLVRELERIRASTAGGISVESGVRTWRLFLRNDLYDDLWLFVHPVVAGQGDKLFDKAGDFRRMVLSESRTYKNGVIGSYYRSGVSSPE